MADPPPESPSTIYNSHSAASFSEQWLAAASRTVEARFASVGAPLPAKRRMACGFPLGARSSNYLGQAWTNEVSPDGSYEILISPVLDNASRVFDVLVHELTHIAVGLDEGHKGRFVEVAKAMGLKAPWTATTATPEFHKWADPILLALGNYPHARMSIDGVVLIPGGLPVPKGSPGGQEVQRAPQARDPAHQN